MEGKKMTCTYVKSNSVEAQAPYWPRAGGSVNDYCALMGSIQQLLKNIGWYIGTVDSRPGTATAQAIQLSLRPGAIKGWVEADGAYTGPNDGNLGYNSAVSLQKLAELKGGYNGPIDGDPREASWTGYRNALQSWYDAGIRRT